MLVLGGSPLWRQMRFGGCYTLVVDVVGIVCGPQRDVNRVEHHRPSIVSSCLANRDTNMYVEK